jgi:Rps23 Pro-64 3,4-dihydroxylase Tpa1-like proline 4-hydroxylase
MRLELIENSNGSVIILDDIFSQETYDTILNQALDLIHSEEIHSHDKIGTAIVDNQYLSRRKGLLLDRIFKENRSNFLYFEKHYEILRKTFSNIKNLPFVFRGIERTNFDESLLGIYDKKDFYRMHNDSSLYTAIFFLHADKKFQGGDLIFDEMNLKVDFIKNRLIIFPGWTYHSVSEVKYPENHEPNFNEFRMSITTFYLIK